jgi:hypothetical protein
VFGNYFDYVKDEKNLTFSHNGSHLKGLSKRMDVFGNCVS